MKKQWVRWPKEAPKSAHEEPPNDDPAPEPSKKPSPRRSAAEQLKVRQRSRGAEAVYRALRSFLPAVLMALVTASSIFA